MVDQTKKNGHVESTLTRGEILANLQVGQPPAESLPACTRLAIDWYGDVAVEFDPITWHRLGVCVKTDGGDARVRLDP